MEKSFKIYYTSDTHGHVFPVDYATNKTVPTGLINMASQIKKDGDTLVLDGGDSLQGTPLIHYYLENYLKHPGDFAQLLNRPATPGDFCFHPVAEAFNYMGLDYFTLGNHDFNFGYEAIRDYLLNMHATCICANVEDHTGELGIRPYIVHTLSNGLRIGITGVVTSFVNIWDGGEHLSRIKVADDFKAVREICRILKPQCDVCVCIYHGGYEEDLKTGKLLQTSGENLACKIARELDFDLLLTGHQHIPVEGMSLYGTYTLQPPANGGKFFYISGKWDGAHAAFTSRLTPVGSLHPTRLFESLLPLEKKVQTWLDQPIGSLQQSITPEVLPGAALNGSRLASLINNIQMEQTHADFSCTSLGNDPLQLKNPVTMRAVVSAYLFNNTLVVLEVTRKILLMALERCAAFFTLKNDQTEVSDDFMYPKKEYYNYDFYAGLSYTFDIRKPVGQRVVNLTKLDGSPLGDQKYSLCMSDYRASGTGGYDFFRDCPVLSRGNQDMQELIATYIRSHSPVPDIKNQRARIIP